MAKTVIAYPASDISVEHDKYPSDTANAYTLVNDETSDDDTSYIIHTLATSSTNCTSTFKCDNTSVNGKIYITGISSLIRSKYESNYTQVNSPLVRTSVSINDGASVDSSDITPTDSYVTNTYTYQGVSGLNRIYNSISDANIVVGVYTSGYYTSAISKDTFRANIRVTQANVTITYMDVFDTSAEVIPGSGISSASCSETEVVDGNTCTFSAVLESGVDFDGWYSDFECTDLVSASQTYVATITADTTLYAKGKARYNINVYADANCTVSTTKQTAYIGDSVTITATPNSQRYEFVGWYSNPERTTLITTQNPYTFNVTGNSTFYAKTVLNEIMYVKLNNVWVQCSKVYKKIDNSWVEQESFDGLFDTNKNYKIIQV